ncbi:MAG TPA: hypothetical protein VLE53_15950 [Gemmatimonadaceae bacterium]|nr:hypothetical protein [Gemmatimonadaceae bacterium]
MSDPQPTDAAMRRFRGTLALSVIGGSATGVLGLVFGVLSFLSDDGAAAGSCFLAAAVAFGLLANALLRR